MYPSAAVSSDCKLGLSSPSLSLPGTRAEQEKATTTEMHNTAAPADTLRSAFFVDRLSFASAPPGQEMER
jgi:hypothetical protein